MLRSLNHASTVEFSSFSFQHFSQVTKFIMFMIFMPIELKCAALYSFLHFFILISFFTFDSSFPFTSSFSFISTFYQEHLSVLSVCAPYSQCPHSATCSGTALQGYYMVGMETGKTHLQK